MLEKRWNYFLCKSKCNMTFGEKVKILRQQKGFSQEKLVEEAGLSLRTIQRIEKGDSYPRPYPACTDVLSELFFLGKLL